MSQLKPGMGCTLDGAAPDNKAVERGGLGARGRVEGWNRGVSKTGEGQGERGNV